jgi:hypothetical protein
MEGIFVRVNPLFQAKSLGIKRCHYFIYWRAFHKLEYDDGRQSFNNATGNFGFFVFTELFDRRHDGWRRKIVI